MLRRIAPAVLATAVIAAALTGCSSADANEVDRGDCKPVLSPGVMSDSVVVLGGFNAEPQVKIPSDTDIATTQRSIVDSSDVKKNAPVAGANSVVSVNFELFEQSTGEQLYRTDGFAAGEKNRKNEFFLLSEDAANPLVEAVRCAVPGERIVLAMSQTDSIALHNQLGGDFETGIIAVIDVEAVSGLRAEGPVRGLPNGFPAVVTDSTGRVGMVLPPRDAPTGSTAAVRIMGDGPKVAKDDTIIVQVLSVSWTGSVLSNTWADGGPQLIDTEEVATKQGLNFRTELTGKRVGSQVVITEGGDSARAIVVDILAIG